MLDHNSPVSRDFGKRGLTPKYRFGRYGPHNNEAFEAEEIALRREGEMSAVTTRERNRDNAMVERRRIVEVEIGGVRWGNMGTWIEGSLVVVCTRWIRGTTFSVKSGKWRSTCEYLRKIM
jgi:hypothetical protein